MPSYAPFYDPKAKHFEKNSVAELTKAYGVRISSIPASTHPFYSLFDRKNLLVACDPRFGFVTPSSFSFSYHPNLFNLNAQSLPDGRYNIPW